MSGWCKIDVVSDGTNCYTYINGAEDQSLRVQYQRDIEMDRDDPMFIFNRLGDISMPPWMSSSMILSDFRYELRAPTKNEIEHFFRTENDK
jgi:hypothetical protein